ncbi:MAG: GNAT family N-acetyltransferase [Alphaproteobacteria bacterium]|nr:GNAT family N-acetyltransferase [Alphaproteobacteria bacterium]
MIPVLSTARLILRGYRSEDFEPFAEFMADADVTRWLNGKPQPRPDAWRNFAGSIGHWVLRGYGTWAVERKEDGAFIGRVGMINPEGWPGLEVGWTLGKPYWGKGYATEAALATMRYAFLTQPVARIISCIHPDNLPSQAVAKRLGETRGERSELMIGGTAFPIDIWSISRAEFEKRERERASA